MDQPSNTEELLPLDAGSSIDLHAIAIALLRRKRLFVFASLGCALIAYAYTAHQPVTYQAQVELLPPQATRSVGIASLAGSGIAETGLNALGMAVQAKSQVDSFSVILQAWPIQDGLVKRFNLVAGYKASNPTAARHIFASRTIVTGTREGFVTISIIDTDKQRAADLANAYVDQTREFLRGLALSEASQRRAFYEVQLGSAKEALIKAEDSFRQMQQKTGIFSVDAQAQALLGEAASLRSQVTAKELEIQSLKSYSTPQNPQVQIAEAELAALHGQLSQLESRGQGGYTGKSLSSVPGTELDFVRATRDLKYQESLYDLMVKQYEGSKLDEARDAPTIQVIEPALIPDHKFGPHKAKAALNGFVIGFIASLIFVLYRYWSNQMSPESTNKWQEYRRALRWSA